MFAARTALATWAVLALLTFGVGGRYINPIKRDVIFTGGPVIFSGGNIKFAGGGVIFAESDVLFSGSDSVQDQLTPMLGQEIKTDDLTNKSTSISASNALESNQDNLTSQPVSLSSWDESVETSTEFSAKVKRLLKDAQNWMISEEPPTQSIRNIRSVKAFASNMSGTTDNISQITNYPIIPVDNQLITQSTVRKIRSSRTSKLSNNPMTPLTSSARKSRSPIQSQISSDPILPSSNQSTTQITNYSTPLTSSTRKSRSSTQSQISSDPILPSSNQSTTDITNSSTPLTSSARKSRSSTQSQISSDPILPSSNQSTTQITNSSTSLTSSANEARSPDTIWSILLPSLKRISLMSSDQKQSNCVNDCSKPTTKNTNTLYHPIRTLRSLDSLNSNLSHIINNQLTNDNITSAMSRALLQSSNADNDTQSVAGRSINNDSPSLKMDTASTTASTPIIPGIFPSINLKQVSVVSTPKSAITARSIRPSISNNREETSISPLELLSSHSIENGVDDIIRQRDQQQKLLRPFRQSNGKLKGFAVAVESSAHFLEIHRHGRTVEPNIAPSAVVAENTTNLAMTTTLPKGQLVEVNAAARLERTVLTDGNRGESSLDQPLSKVIESADSVGKDSVLDDDKNASSLAHDVELTAPTGGPGPLTSDSASRRTRQDKEPPTPSNSRRVYVEYISNYFGIY